MARLELAGHVPLAAVTLTLLALSADAQEDVDRSDRSKARTVIVEDLRNDHPAFCVRVDVDRPDRTYVVGDEVNVTVTSGKPGYLYLIYMDVEGNCVCLFPNCVQRNNYVPAEETIVIPEKTAKFRLRVGRPTGHELLKAIVTTEPLNELELERLTQGDYSVLPLDQMKAVSGELTKGNAGNWAEHFIEIITRPGNSPDRAGRPPHEVFSQDHAPVDSAEAAQIRPQAENSRTQGVHQQGMQPRRVGLFVGISQFADDQIPDLTICHRDAQSLAEAMQQHSDLDEVRVLVDEDAKLANIQQAASEWLPQATRPGDLIVLYWSGHGARCVDDNGDELDGYDEYLVPHDGSLGDLQQIRQTMLMDDTFGRWIQNLDGRRLVIILDTCHSGGQSSREKGIGGPSPPPAGAEFDFFDGELARTKDIGQRETAMLASSKADQISFERRENDLSVMTFCLVRLLQGVPGPLTLKRAFSQLERDVPRYVQENFPGTIQTPVLIDNTTSPVYLRSH